MASNEAEHPRIAERVPRREWLLRCQDSSNELAICSLDVADGEIEVVGPGDQIFTLEGSDIAAFRSALNEAIVVAEADLAQQ